MHVKWNRNLDGIRSNNNNVPLADSLYEQSDEVSSIRSYNKNGKEYETLVESKDGNNNESHLALAQRRINTKARRHLFVSSPKMNRNQASMMKQSFHANTTNRVTSKGALSTLIGLFGFGHEHLNQPIPQLNRVSHNRRRRLSLDRISSSNDSSHPLSHKSNSSYRRTSSLVSLNELVSSDLRCDNSVNVTKTLVNISDISKSSKSRDITLYNSPRNDRSFRKDARFDTSDKVKRSIVKFVDDEPCSFDSNQHYEIATLSNTAKLRPGILRIRNPSESSEIISFRSSSSSSPSSSSSMKRVQFAHPLLTYAIFDDLNIYRPKENIFQASH